MQIADKWFRDIPQQFLGKENIEVLVRAFARQLQELRQVFDDLRTELDLGTAAGQNLDYVGNIVSLTRKEAGELAGIKDAQPVMPDERYRLYLQYKVLRNTSECTYYDVMKAIEILWDVDKASYYERRDRPATIFIGLPAVDIEDDDQARGKPSILKPAGVGFIYTAQYSTAIDQSLLEKVKFPGLDIYACFYYFARRLDGRWFLDGSIGLGQRPLLHIGMETAIGPIGVACKVQPGLPVLDIYGGALETIARDRCAYETGIRMDNAGLGEVGRADVGFAMQVPGKWDAGTGGVTVRKDYWQLDGQYLLDGQRILDAEVREEEL